VKSLLIATAVIEAGAGLALLASPSVFVALLFGTTLESASAVAISRITGAALLSLGIACWLARGDAQSRAARGLIVGMLLYNTAVAGLLIEARLGSGLAGIALWPGVVLHLGMAGWCIACLRMPPR
jgi:hypothetical protein